MLGGYAHVRSGSLITYGSLSASGGGVERRDEGNTPFWGGKLSILIVTPVAQHGIMGAYINE